MSVDPLPTRFAPHESARVLALSSAIASAVVFLFLLDFIAFGRFDPGYQFFAMLRFGGDSKSLPPRSVAPILFSLWTGAWLLSGLDAIRSRGSGRVAAFNLCVLIGGVCLYFIIIHVIRGPMLRGVGVR